MHSPLSELTAADFERWNAALGRLPATRIELLDWLDGPVRRFFPFERVFCAHGELVAGEIRPTDWLGSGHAPDVLERMAATFMIGQRGSLGRWLAHRVPVLVDPANPAEYVSPFELDEIAALGLRNTAAHGVLNPKANAGTYFSFAGLGTSPSAWHAQALVLLAPALHDRFVSLVAATGAPPDLSNLTPRQLEIVRGVAAGLDDKTIARRLDVAEKTIRNQLSDIYGRLGIRKRTQLMALVR